MPCRVLNLMMEFTGPCTTGYNISQITIWHTDICFDWTLSTSDHTALLRCTPSVLIFIQSQSHIANDGQSVNKSWCRAPSGAHDQIFITLWQLRSYFCGAPSLTRGLLCLALASAVFLGSESLGTRGHILLSQIWDFPFRRLLRLAGSKWRCSIRPLLFSSLFCTTYIAPTRIHRKHVHFLAMNVYCCPERESTGPLPNNRCPAIVERLCHGNVFVDSFPSSGSTCGTTFGTSYTSFRISVLLCRMEYSVVQITKLALLFKYFISFNNFYSYDFIISCVCVCVCGTV
jgi:hypothetical protein